MVVGASVVVVAVVVVGELVVVVVVEVVVEVVDVSVVVLVVVGASVVVVVVVAVVVVVGGLSVVAMLSHWTKSFALIWKWRPVSVGKHDLACSCSDCRWLSHRMLRHIRLADTRSHLFLC